jgi:hypothetical protein
LHRIFANYFARLGDSSELDNAPNTAEAMATKRTKTDSDFATSRATPRSVEN